MNELLTPEQVAEHFKVSKKFVLNKCAKGEWAHLRLASRLVRFTADQVSAIEEMTAREPITEIVNLFGNRGRRTNLL